MLRGNTVHGPGGRWCFEAASNSRHAARPVEGPGEPRLTQPGAAGTIEGNPQLGWMDNPSKTIGEGLRRLFSAFIRRPMGWNLIDALTRLEEREEEETPHVDEMDKPDVAHPR